MTHFVPRLPRSACPFLAAGLFAPLALLAQNPELAPSDLAYSQLYAAKRRLKVHVEMHTVLQETVEYQYDRCPGVVRIIDGDKMEYAKPDGQPWVKSNDWGKTGKAVEDPMAKQLDMEAELAEAPWGESTHADKTQGGEVWKLEEQSSAEGTEHFTYELSRERPRPSGSYPLLTFAKRKNDTEGRLLLEHSSANVRTDTGLVPVEASYQYTFPPPEIAKDLAGYETWITGKVFTKNNTLLFRVDKAVPGNTTGDIVLLGANKEEAGVLLPMYVRAAEKHARLRLYGVLMPVTGQRAEGSPSVQFITWKLHGPDDPDELPENRKLIIHEGDKVDGSGVYQPTK